MTAADKAADKARATGYTVRVRGTVPEGLGGKVSEAHAAALLSCGHGLPEDGERDVHEPRNSSSSRLS